MIRSRWMAATAFGALLLAVAPALAQTAQPVAAAAAPAEAPSRGLSLRDMAMMERVSDPRVSPDGRQVIYSVRTTDWDANKGVNSLWLADVAGGAPRKLPSRTTSITPGSARAGVSSIHDHSAISIA